MSGWICSYRKIWDHPLFAGNAMRVGAWHWMMHKAVISDTRFMADGQVITLTRGQFCASHHQMCEATGMTRKQLRTFLEALESESAVVLKRAKDRAKGRTVITICNYDEYQNMPDGEGPSRGQGRAKQGPTKEQYNKITREEGPYGPLSSGDDGAPRNDPSEAGPADDVAEAVAVYREAAERIGWPTPQKIDAVRRKAIGARIKDAGGVDGWKCAIGKAEQSSFLGCARPFSGFGIDWLSKPKNFTKIMEGNYDARSSSTGNPSGPTHGRRDRQPSGLVGAAMRSIADRAH